MYHISSATSHWTFEVYYEDKSRLNSQGLKQLKTDYVEVLKPLRANCYDVMISDTLKSNDILFGPISNDNNNYKVRHPKSGRWCNLYKADLNNKFSIIPVTIKNTQKANQTELYLYDFGWFKFKNGDDKLYFYSRKYQNICATSIYWTDWGESYLIARRKRYIFMRDNPYVYGPEQIKSYKYLPGYYIQND